jgi:hypothetical protein
MVAAGLRGVEGADLDPVVASFTDADPNAAPADFEATIDWNDGTTTQGAIALVGGTPTQTDFQVSGDHIYAEEGVYPIDVTVTTLGSNPVSTTSTATIADAPLTAVPATANLPEGVPESGEVVATFTDANPDATAADFDRPTIASENPAVTASNPTVIQIGGGNGTPAVFAVTANLTGNDDNSSGSERDGGGLLVTITDVGGSAASVSSQVNLFDPVLIDPGVGVQTVAGSPFQGNVATFSTTDLRASTSEFTAVINWGDGQSSSGTIVGTGPGQFRVVGDHTYARPGSYTVSSTISDDEGQSVSDTSSAAVSTPPIAARGLAMAMDHRKSFSGKVATFTSPVAVPAGGITALINWGDGTSSSGVVSSRTSPSGATTFTVSGSHHFARRQPSPVTLTIVESGGGQTVIPLVTGLGANHRAAAASQPHPGTRSHAGGHSLVRETSHPAGPRALLPVRSHSMAALPASRTAALIGRLP